MVTWEGERARERIVSALWQCDKIKGRLSKACHMTTYWLLTCLPTRLLTRRTHAVLMVDSVAAWLRILGIASAKLTSLLLTLYPFDLLCCYAPECNAFLLPPLFANGPLVAVLKWSKVVVGGLVRTTESNYLHRRQNYLSLAYSINFRLWPGSLRCVKRWTSSNYTKQYNGFHRAKEAPPSRQPTECWMLSVDVSCQHKFTFNFVLTLSSSNQSLDSI